MPRPLAYSSALDDAFRYTRDMAEYHEIKIRFNTHADENEPLKWRVLIDGQEFLASEVTTRVPTMTTRDELSPDLVKFHITCYGAIQWEGSKVHVF